MVYTHSKLFIFSAFFSLNLLVSGLYAGNNFLDGVRAGAPYAAAAVVAKIVENRILGEGSVCPVRVINEIVPTEFARETVNCVVKNAEGEQVEIQREVVVAEAAVRRIGVQVGVIPVHLLTIHEHRMLKNLPWLQAVVRALNADVVVPGVNLKNAFEIYLALKALNSVQSHLPAFPKVLKK